MATEKQIKVFGNRIMVDLGIEVEADGKKHRLVMFDKFMSCYYCSLLSHCEPKGEFCFACGVYGGSKIFIPKEAMNDKVKLINYLKL